LKDGNWVPIDVRVTSLLPHNREYTFLEAYISFRCDLEKNAPYTINGYAKMWGWSRNKVRTFIEKLRTGEGHSVDTQRTGKGHEIRIIFNNLPEQKDRRRIGKGQSRDTQEDTTINPNNIKKKNYAENVLLSEAEYQKLIEENGQEKTTWMIEKLNNAKGAKGYTYKSDYRAILTWVVGEAKKSFKPQHTRDPMAGY